MAAARNRLKFIAIAAALVSCTKGGAVASPNGNAGNAGATAAAEPAPIVVTLGKTTTEAVERTVFVIGTLAGEEELVLSAKASGRIVGIAKDLGDRVGPGEVLAQIDRKDYELAVEQARMALQESLANLGLTAPPADDFDPLTLPGVLMTQTEKENAQTRFHRGELMYHASPPLITEQEFTDLQAALDVARAAYEVAARLARGRLAEAHSRQADLAVKEHALAETTVRAPTAEELKSSTVAASGGDERERYGVAKRLVSVGEYVTTGTPLFRLVADRTLRFRASAPERFLKDVALGQTVRVHSETATALAEGKVVRINPEVNRVNRTFEIEVALQNLDGRLHAGSFGEGDVVVGVDPAAIFAPQDAVMTWLGTSRLFTVKDGKAVEISVKTGVRRGARVQITEGLAVATGSSIDVVVGGATKLANGVKVTVMAPTSSASPAAPSGSK
jgi:multidrug efflux pump subunit AcrA (membrane-fusion protein)